MDRIDGMRLFVRLAERQSFSAAAKDLKIKQSTASKWIAELEAQVGTSLVDRTTRSLHFTDAGRRFLARATELLTAFDDLTQELQAQNPEPSGRVRMSLPVVFGRLFLQRPIVEFLRRHQRVEAELVLGDRYVNLVEEGFDLAVRVGLPVDTSARGRKLADSRRCLVASPAYLKAHGKPRRPNDLKQHHCLLLGEATSTGIWRFGRPRGPTTPITVRSRLAANSSDAIVEMARSGLGVALLANWLVESDLKKQRLIQLLPSYQTPPAPIYALTPPGRYSTVAVRALIDHLATSLAARLPAAR